MIQLDPGFSVGFPQQFIRIPERRFLNKSPKEFGVFSIVSEMDTLSNVIDGPM